MFSKGSSWLRNWNASPVSCLSCIAGLFFTCWATMLFFSYSVMSNSFQPHGLQLARLPCPSPSPRVCSDSCPLNRWWHPTISSPVTAFSACPQSFVASGSFPVSWLFASGGQSTGASSSSSVLPMSIQGFPLGFIGLTFQSKGLSKVFFNITVQKHQFFGTQLSLYGPTLTSVHDYWKNYIVLSNYTPMKFF